MHAGPAESEEADLVEWHALSLRETGHTLRIRRSRGHGYEFWSARAEAFERFANELPEGHPLAPRVEELSAMCRARTAIEREREGRFRL